MKWFSDYYQLGIFEVFAIYFTVCLIYFALISRLRGFQEGIYRFVFVVFLPVFGFFHFLLTGIFGKVIKKTESIVDVYIKYIYGDRSIEYVQQIDFEKDINTIPLEDSIYFSDSRTRRSYLVHILKKDFLKHVRSLKRAVEIGDSETAHYAASALTEIKKQFEGMIQAAREKYNDEPDNLEILQEYIGVVRRYLYSGLADRVDYNDYLEEYSRLLEIALKKLEDKRQYFSEKISLEIQKGNYKVAESYCREFLTHFPKDEEPYLCAMELYFATGNYHKFYQVLSELKSLNIPLSEKAKSMINFWENEEAGLGVR
ncbi:MAG: hypothetical protein H5T85_00145 [Actinobacteria bacterium]|nr:hypothetical protein [Actinomycetota bacterium]